jgi:DNA-directed RNA polymerase sigma subunit (sigma70/sigma32)
MLEANEKNSMTVKECSDIRETADLLLYLSKNSMIDTPQIKSLLDDLTDRERRIIELRFGIDGECHTLADCGMKLD